MGKSECFYFIADPEKAIAQDIQIQKYGIRAQKL